VSVDLGPIRSAVAAKLAAAFPNVQVSAYFLPDPTPPTLHIMPDEPLATFDAAMVGGDDHWFLMVEALVPYTLGSNAEVKLEPFISRGTGGVKAVLEAEATLGGLANWLMVRQVDSYGQISQADGTTHFGCRFHIELTTTI
jgi:hypothetical protein